MADFASVLAGMISVSIREGDIKALRNLIEKRGIRVNDVVEPEEKNTPLHIATQYGNAEICKLLMEKGADPSIRNRNGLTPTDILKTWYLLMISISLVPLI